MKNTHPYKVRATVYLVLPTLLLVFAVVSAVVAEHYGNQSRAGTNWGAFAGSCFLLWAVYGIPFTSYGLHYWRLKAPKAISLPPADEYVHGVGVSYTTHAVAQLFNFMCSPSGTLSWVNSTQVLTLTQNKAGQLTTVFQVPYSAIEYLSDEFNSLRIKVNGRAYMCTPNGSAVDQATAIGYTAGQGATIALGTLLFQQAGVPELVERVRAAGVRVATVQIQRSIELGVIISFVLLFVGSLCWSVFVVKHSV